MSPVGLPPFHGPARPTILFPTPTNGEIGPTVFAVIFKPTTLTAQEFSVVWIDADMFTGTGLFWVKFHLFIPRSRQKQAEGNMRTLITVCRTTA
jgi:hypothetical protein